MDEADFQALLDAINNADEDMQHQLQQIFSPDDEGIADIDLDDDDVIDNDEEVADDEMVIIEI